MKYLNKYILEKLKISKNTKEDIDLNDLLVNMCKIDEEAFLNMIQVELNLIDVKYVNEAILLTLYSTELPIAKEFFDTELLKKYFKNSLSDFPESKATELKYDAKNTTIREYKDKDKKPIGFDIVCYSINAVTKAPNGYGIYIFKK